MADDADGYQAYYSGKLWSLLPEIYRTSDAASTFDPNALVQPNGPLRELVNRIGAQAATLRRSIDRMWEDQSIESCDDWVIPYIGAQLATNLVSSLDARAQRLDVARTIYFRQRKGTIPILEEIAEQVTGWDARVVELFRRLARARHGLDPAVGAPPETGIPDPDAPLRPALPVESGLIGANTRTPLGGYAALRNDYGASRVGTAFNEFSHTVDVRLGQGKTGWYNVPKLGVFLWRLQSVLVQGVTPVAATGRGRHYTFDPTGRDTQLFAAPARAYDAGWLPRPEYRLPAPIDERLLKFALTELYATADPTNGIVVPNAIGLYNGPPNAATLVPSDHVSGNPRDVTHYVIDPVRGLITVPAGVPLPPAQFTVGYRYGFSSSIGAGGYDRRLRGRSPAPVLPVMPTVTGGGGNIVATTGGTVEIGDSLTYDRAPNYAINGASGANSLVVRASNLQRPLVRFARSTAAGAQWTFTGSTDSGGSSILRLDGIFVSGGDIVLAGNFDRVTLSTCTLDPGDWEGTAARRAIDGRRLVASHLTITGSVRDLVIERCILGPISTTGNGSIETLNIADSIMQAGSPNNPIAIATGETTINGCTVLGKASFRQLDASNSIFADQVTVADDQQGCVRFSAWTQGSVLPRQYECTEFEPGQELFASTAFGRPHYAQLLASVKLDIAQGAEDGSEMGAFFRNKNPIKERSLLIKYQEFMPIGLTPVLIYMT